VVDEGNGTQLLQEGEEVGEQERKMIQGILSLEDVTAREVMVPRVDIVASEASALLPVVSALMSEGGHSRIPIYDETIDTVVGIVHARDLLKYLSIGDTAARLTVREIARSPVFIPESKPLDELLQEFQEQHVTIAVVVDEYGGTEGLITMEDMVEEIVGEIEDEFQREEPTVTWVSENEVVMDARVSLDEVNDSLGTSLEGDGFDTLGGLLYARFGKIPASGEEVALDALRMQVLSTSGRRIRKVRILFNRG
jgi:CBS domain containing-hemolysin-like protein